MFVYLFVCLFNRAFLGHFITHWGALWHKVAFWFRKGSKTIIFVKTEKMWKRCTKYIIFSRFGQLSRPFRNRFGCPSTQSCILVLRRCNTRILSQNEKNVETLHGPKIKSGVTTHLVCLMLISSRPSLAAGLFKVVLTCNLNQFLLPSDSRGGGVWEGVLGEGGSKTLYHHNTIYFGYC